jgi:hypothetical protein
VTGLAGGNAGEIVFSGGCGVALIWWWLSVSVMVMMAPPSRSWRHRASSVVFLSLRLLTAVALLAPSVSGVGSGVGVLLWC